MEVNATITQDDFINIITDMTVNSERAQVVLKMAAVNLICLLLRLVKQCRLHPRLAFVTSTVELATQALLPFFLVFGMFLCAFAYAGIFLFGQEELDFVNMSYAVLKMWNMLLGDFDTEMYMNGEQFDWIKISWFLIFFMLGFYILLNMLLAIVMDAYSKVGESIDNDAPDICTDYMTLCHYYRRYLRRRLLCKKNRSKLFYNEMADVIETQSLALIETAFSKDDVHKTMVAQFGREFDHMAHSATFDHTELTSSQHSRMVAEDEGEHTAFPWPSTAFFTAFP